MNSCHLTVTTFLDFKVKKLMMRIYDDEPPKSMMVYDIIEFIYNKIQQHQINDYIARIERLYCMDHESRSIGMNELLNTIQGIISDLKKSIVDAKSPSKVTCLHVRKESFEPDVNNSLFLCKDKDKRDSQLYLSRTDKKYALKRIDMIVFGIVLIAFISAHDNDSSHEIFVNIIKFAKGVTKLSKKDRKISWCCFR